MIRRTIGRLLEMRSQQTTNDRKLRCVELNRLKLYQPQIEQVAILAMLTMATPVTTPVATPALLPAFTSQGVLPPYVGLPADTNGRSPYRVSLLDFAQRFATSTPRIEILKGFLVHRARLLAAGIIGFQWLDGSFVENIEAEGRVPSALEAVINFPRMY
jgi:hypothetical protein